MADSKMAIRWGTVRGREGSPEEGNATAESERQLGVT